MERIVLALSLFFNVILIAIGIINKWLDTVSKYYKTKTEKFNYEKLVESEKAANLFKTDNGLFSFKAYKKNNTKDNTPNK